jgi:hypothetical protein
MIGGLLVQYKYAEPRRSDNFRRTPIVATQTAAHKFAYLLAQVR